MKMEYSRFKNRPAAAVEMELKDRKYFFFFGWEGFSEC